MVVSGLWYILIDLVGLVQLVQIWESRTLCQSNASSSNSSIKSEDKSSNSTSTKDTCSNTLRSRTWLPPFTTHLPTLCLIYLFNPYTLLACLARSTTCLENTLVLLAISSASRRQDVATAFWLAIAACTSVYPCLLVPPVMLVLLSRQSSQAKNGQSPKIGQWVMGIILMFGGFSAGLVGIARIVVGDWTWIRSTWMSMWVWCAFHP